MYQLVFGKLVHLLESDKWKKKTQVMEHGLWEVGQVSTRHQLRYLICFQPV